MKSFTARLAVLAVFAAAASGAYANVTRCANGLASVGDTKPAVLQKCGAPQYKESFCSMVGTGGGVVVGGTRARPVVVNTPPACIPIDEWTYVPASGSFMTILRFEEGRVTTITSGDRVP